MERDPASTEGLRYIHCDFDFMVDGEGAGTDNVFRRAARMYTQDEGEHLNATFKYGEKPYSANGDGYFAIYAEVHQVHSWAEAEARHEQLFDKIVTNLGSLGLTLLNRDYQDHDGDMTLIDTSGQRLAILGGQGMSGGNNDQQNSTVQHWGVNDFPEVRLTK